MISKSAILAVVTLFGATAASAAEAIPSLVCTIENSNGQSIQIELPRQELGQASALGFYWAKSVPFAGATYAIDANVSNYSDLIFMGLTLTKLTPEGGIGWKVSGAAGYKAASDFHKFEASTSYQDFAPNADPTQLGLTTSLDCKAPPAAQTGAVGATGPAVVNAESHDAKTVSGPAQDASSSAASTPGSAQAAH